MRNNQILSAAIMAALAGAGASPFASAANNLCGGTIGKNTSGTCIIGLNDATIVDGSWTPAPTLLSTPTLPGTIATEVIGDGWLVDDTALSANGKGKTLTAVYCLGAGSNGPGATGGTIQTDFYVTYTLAGAKFVLTSDSTSTTVTDATLPTGTYGVKGTDFRANLAGGSLGNTTSQTAVSFAYVSPEQNVVKFLVQAQTTNKINDGDTLYFSFDIKDFDVLKSAGGSVSLTTSFVKTNGETMSIAGDCSSTIVNSAKGISPTISSNNITTDADKAVYIDVENASTRFTSASGKDHSTYTGKEGCFAVLGSIDFSSASGSGKLSDLKTGATVDGVNLSASEATLTIDNAPLNATGSTICIDMGGTSTTSTTPDLLCGDPESTTTPPATYDLPSEDTPTLISGETTATLKLTGDQATDLMSGAYNILIGVDCANITAIKPLDGPARAKLAVTYTEPFGTGGGNKAEYTGTLKWIKRNGSDCTLYNVPSPSAIENANVRVTNKSGKDATLFGILIKMDGSPVFGTAQAPVELGKFVDNQTLYFDSAALAKIAGDNKGPTDWGRGVLRLISGASKMEAYGLVRGKDAGAPLQNMSVGASGNGCD
jgi:hypothetical protein